MTAAITDFTHFAELRRGAEGGSNENLREVAGQFEALFLQSMLKSMRDASIGDPLFGDSDAHEMYQGMFDQQLAMEMASGQGIGLAEMLVRQLGGEQAARALVPTDLRFERTGLASKASTMAGATTQAISKASWATPESFARDVWPHAKRVAAQLDVPPEGILAQAALETGWGQHVMPDKNGSSSFNLFGIKAGGSWGGNSVTRNTIEFDGNTAHREMANFRSYDDIGQTFDDYAELLSENPRYSQVRNHSNDIDGFAGALQQSGYATDPAYAQKISRVATSDTMHRVLGGLKNASMSPILP